MTKEELLKLVKEYPRHYSQMLKKYNYNGIFDKILNFCELNNILYKTYAQAIYHYIYDLKEIPKCSTCKEKFLPFHGFDRPYLSFCSNKCIVNDPKISKMKAIKQSLNGKYTTKAFNKKINDILIDDSIEILSDENLKLEILNLVKTRSLDNLKSYILKNHKNIFKSLSLKIKDFNKISLSEAFYRIVNNIEEIPICTICNETPVWFKSFKSGYMDTCKNSSCFNTLPKRKKRESEYQSFKTATEDRNCLFLTKKDQFIEKGNNQILIRCSCGNIRKTSVSTFLFKGSICRCCFLNNKRSNIEEIIKIFLEKFVKTEKSVALFPKELDIFIPDKNIGIEFDGLYWHSETVIKNKNYHLDKTEKCKKKGIQLLHIFEDEWAFKENIVKSVLLSKLGIYENRIYARKCEVKEINTNLKNSFLNENHLQGRDLSSIRLGLFYNDELVSVMTFGKRKITGAEPKLELIRFASKLNTQVIGGASKLFKYFLKNYDFSEILSYADRRWSNGNFYEKLGFRLDHISRPNYWYIKNGKREHRVNYQKHKLSNLLEKYDESLTEYENMLNNRYHRIWDCGNYVFVFNK
jgi:hypothetical protein